MPCDENIIHLLQNGHPGRGRCSMNPSDPPILIRPPAPAVVKAGSDVINQLIWPEVRRGHHPLPRRPIEDPTEDVQSHRSVATLPNAE